MNRTVYASPCRGLRPPTYKNQCPVDRYSQSPTFAANSARPMSGSSTTDPHIHAPVGRYSQSPTFVGLGAILIQGLWASPAPCRGLRPPTHKKPMPHRSVLAESDIDCNASPLCRHYTKAGKRVFTFPFLALAQSMQAFRCSACMSLHRVSELSCAHIRDCPDGDMQP